MKEEYNMEDLHIYNRDTLTKLVLWLDEREDENTFELMKCHEKLEIYIRGNYSLRNENMCLMKENEEFRRLPNMSKLCCMLLLAYYAFSGLSYEKRVQIPITFLNCFLFMIHLQPIE